MQTITIKNVTIGEGIPKICAPIVGKDMEAILSQARRLTELPVDVAEWRADWMDNITDDREVLDVLEALSNCLGDMPLLMTFRTKAEGGEAFISSSAYEHLYHLAIQSGRVDMIDIELMCLENHKDSIGNLISEAHNKGVCVVMSNHDFQKTPDKAEILNRLRRMEQLEADILKIAVMPDNKKDVLTLLGATEEMTSETERPLVTMSMGGLGLISRLSGEIFGSAMTFGSAGQASAPGQIEVKKLREILTEMHRNIK